MMDVIGYAASVSQLLVYISSSAVSLQRLWTELRNSDSTYRNEETNVNLLLNILQRLSRQDIKDHNPVLPVLIAISGTACQVLHLLQPKKIFGINWTLITSQEKIQSAFQSLDKQRRLLHLYISQSHHDALVNLRETIVQSSMATSQGSSTGGSNESNNPFTPPTSDGSNTRSQNREPLKVKATKVKIDGFSSQYNGPDRPGGDFEINDFEVGANGTSFSGNEVQPSGSEWLNYERTRRESANRAPPSQAAPSPQAAPKGPAAQTSEQTPYPPLRLEGRSYNRYTANASAGLSVELRRNTNGDFAQCRKR